MTTKFVKNTDRTIIGVDNLHYSVLKSDTPEELTYGEMVKFPNTIEISVTVNSETNTLYADNKPAIIYSNIGNVEVSIDKTTIPNSTLGELLGSPMDGGVRHITSTGDSPYVGIAWRQVFSDGKYAYLKLFKGKFSEPDRAARTKEESVDFQTQQITAQFAATNHEIEGKDGDKFPLLMAVAEEEDENYADEGKTWFNAMFPVSGAEK